jgi:hypothetical protein
MGISIIYQNSIHLSLHLFYHTSLFSLKINLMNLTYHYIKDHFFIFINFFFLVLSLNAYIYVYYHKGVKQVPIDPKALKI